MVNRIHYKLGLIEFEAEGDSELIEREREHFFSILPQAITAVSPFVNDKTQIIEVSQDSGDDSPLPLLPEDNSKKYESVALFLNEKSFNTDVERVLGVAYYINQVENEQFITSKDIEDKFTKARFTKPTNINASINQNISKGFICEHNEKKSGFKSFYISNEGIIWVKNYASKDVTTTKKATKIRKPKTESPLVNIPLEDLHLDTYCDIHSIKDLYDQILVIVHIYTNEGINEFFSFNDIVSILKNKFKISVTPRQVQYFFSDKWGNKFDKKTEKKVVYHKIMSSGIKEAERIIAEQKESHSVDNIEL